LPVKALSDVRRPRRTSMQLESKETSNNDRLKELSTDFDRCTADVPLIRYLCSTEIDQALSEARSRTLVTGSIEELRRAARVLRASTFGRGVCFVCFVCFVLFVCQVLCVFACVVQIEVQKCRY
jgi:hypothetical protein